MPMQSISDIEARYTGKHFGAPCAEHDLYERGRRRRRRWLCRFHIYSFSDCLNDEGELSDLAQHVSEFSFLGLQVFFSSVRRRNFDRYSINNLNSGCLERTEFLRVIR